MYGSRRVRFGIFELDLQTGELRKAGVRLPLQEQPFKVLAMLLERPGELVTRDELKQQLWPEAEFGDFDQGLNVAIKKIRTALGDSADSPRFVETLSRRGYRFIAPVTADHVGPTLAPPLPASPKVLRRLPTKAIVAGVVLMVIALGAWSVKRKPREYSLGIFGVAPNFRLTPLTSSMGCEFDPQFSPDGKQIAYVWSPSPTVPPGIYLKVVGAGSPVALLPSKKGVVHILPAWSPDGRYIACVRGVKQEGSELRNVKRTITEQLLDEEENRKPDVGVYVIPAIGGEERKLFDAPLILDLKWAPDGQWFLIGRRLVKEGPASLWRYSMDGTPQKQLTFPPEGFNGDTLPTFSPDGKLIAFSRNFSSGGSDVFVIPASGGEARRITHDGQHVRGLSFSDDGKEIIYSSAREGSARTALWRIAVEGGTPKRLPFGNDNVVSPIMAGTGDHLAYVHISQSAKIYAFEIDKPGIAHREDATDGVPVISSRLMQVGPQYSPDGTRVAFASTRSGPWEIWVSNPDGSNAIQLTNFGDRQTGTPRWSPDGKFIAFDARPEQHSDIYVIDSQGGTPRRITASNFDNVVPSFSRDGQWIYYSSNASRRWELWKTRVDGTGQPIQLTKNGGFSGFESVDGSTVYYVKWDKLGIFSMPAAGGPETLVTIELFAKLWGCWSLQKNGIYFIRPELKNDDERVFPALAFYDFATKEIRNVRALPDAPNPGPSLAISPDQKTMLYTMADVGGSEIMLVENFR